jgi:hypothetical protein
VVSGEEVRAAPRDDPLAEPADDFLAELFLAELFLAELRDESPDASFEPDDDARERRGDPVTEPPDDGCVGSGDSPDDPPGDPFDPPGDPPDRPGDKTRAEPTGLAATLPARTGVVPRAVPVGILAGILAGSSAGSAVGSSAGSAVGSVVGGVAGSVVGGVVGIVVGILIGTPQSATRTRRQSAPAPSAPSLVRSNTPVVKDRPRLASTRHTCCSREATSMPVGCPGAGSRASRHHDRRSRQWARMRRTT